MLRRLTSLSPRRSTETPEEREARLEKRRARSRKTDPVVPFSAAFSDPFSSPRPEAKSENRTELTIDSPKGKSSASKFSVDGVRTPPSSAKKPRLCLVEDAPGLIAATPQKQSADNGAASDIPITATPTSTSKKQSIDRGAGVGLLGSPTPNSSKKPRLSPLEHTPRGAASPSSRVSRSLHVDMQSPGMSMPSPPAESPQVPRSAAGSGDALRAAGAGPAESPQVPHSAAGNGDALRAAGAGPGRPPIAPPSSVGELPACPRLSLNDGSGNSATPLRGSPGEACMLQSSDSQTFPPSSEFDGADDDPFKPPQSARSLASLQREVQRVTSEDPALRASAPAAVFCESSPPAASPQPPRPRRPHSARSQNRPLPALSRAGSALLSGAARAAHVASALTPRMLMSPGRLMSPRRMMSPGRVNSPRCEPPPPVTGAEPAPAAVAVEEPQVRASAQTSSAWLPSPRQPGRDASSAASLHKAQGLENGTEPLDPAEALVQPMLSAVYGRPLSNTEVAAATSVCPEVTWLAQCALLCPLPIGWKQCPAEADTAGISPALYACELTGEVGEQPPHLPRFSKLARLLLHAVTHPEEAHTAAAWLKVEIEDAHSESLRLQESWCRSLDPSSGREFWHNPMTNKSSWESPAAHSAYTAAVAERILDTEPFKAYRAAEAEQHRVAEPQPQPSSARAKSQSAPSNRRSAKTDEYAPTQPDAHARRNPDPEIFDVFEEPPTSKRHRHRKGAGESPVSARRKHDKRMEESSDADYKAPVKHRRSKHGSGSGSGSGSARRNRREPSPPRTPPAIKEFSRAAEESPDAAEPMVFDMSTPPRSQRKSASQEQQPPRAVAPDHQMLMSQPQPASQAQSTDAAVALAGAAAALATAAAALSARGPGSDYQAAANFSARGPGSDYQAAANFSASGLAAHTAYSHHVPPDALPPQQCNVPAQQQNQPSVAMSLGQPDTTPAPNLVNVSEGRTGCAVPVPETPIVPLAPAAPPPPLVKAELEVSNPSQPAAPGAAAPLPPLEEPAALEVPAVSETRSHPDQTSAEQDEPPAALPNPRTPCKVSLPSRAGSAQQSPDASSLAGDSCKKPTIPKLKLSAPAMPVGLPQGSARDSPTPKGSPAAQGSPAAKGSPAPKVSHAPKCLPAARGSPIPKGSPASKSSPVSASELEEKTEDVGIAAACGA